MILIPSEFMPAYLLTYDQVSDRSKKLLDQSWWALNERKWAETERHATAVRDATQRLADRGVDHAIALIHLADLYRTVGRLGPALEHGEDAQQALKNMPGSTHYHNRAVSDYALGLTHHVLGNGDQALKWYEHAKDLFDRAIPYWAHQGDQDSQEQNEDAKKWIDALIDSIVNQEEGLMNNPFFNLAWFPVVSTGVEDEKTYKLARFLISTRRLDSEIVCINEKPYQIMRSDGSQRYSPPLDFEKPYFLTEIEADEGSEGEDLKEGDLALLQGTFVREDGRVRRMQRPRIIGGEKDVIAILRPTESTES